MKSSNSDNIFSQNVFPAKIILLGDAAVGKTALHQKYNAKMFQSHYSMTIGAHFCVKEAKIDGKIIRFHIWDLAGQPPPGSVRVLYYADCRAALIIYDVTRPDSQLNLKKWIDELQAQVPREKIPIVVVGNKIDLRDNSQVHITTSQGIEYIRHLKQELGNITPIDFLETSAKTGYNVDEAFKKLARLVLSTQII